jgi:hypothetical protein
MSYFRLGEWKNPNPASLCDERYRPLQRHQQPSRDLVDHGPEEVVVVLVNDRDGARASPRAA